jgi:hypothetical protein
MKVQPEPVAGHRAATVAASPDAVDAGAEFTLTVRVVSRDDTDLSDDPVVIRDAGGRKVAAGRLTEIDEPDSDAYVYVAEIRVAAPLAAGEHDWRAVLPAAEGDGVRYAEVAAPVSFVVVAHAAEINVWGLPSAISAGERFPLKVGVKCSCGCNLAGRPVEVLAEDGADVGAARLGDAVWPGTSALYFAELEVPAPEAPGYYEWSVTTPAFDVAGKPHAAGRVRFGVRAVAAPDAEVTIEAVDREKQAPIKGIHVLLHPYRALTDERGIARVKVARGRYRLVISGFRYIPYETTIDADGAVTERAELEVEPKGDGYYVP